MSEFLVHLSREEYVWICTRAYMDDVALRSQFGANEKSVMLQDLLTKLAKSQHVEEVVDHS